MILEDLKKHQLIQRLHEMHLPLQYFCQKFLKLLYKKDIGREPTPKQKLTIPNISPTSAAFREKKSIKFIYILGINIIMMWFDMWDKLKTNRMDLEGKLYFFSARRAALPDNPRK